MWPERVLLRARESPIAALREGRFAAVRRLRVSRCPAVRAHVFPHGRDPAPPLELAPLRLLRSLEDALPLLQRCLHLRLLTELLASVVQLYSGVTVEAISTEGVMRVTGFEQFAVVLRGVFALVIFAESHYYTRV